MTEMSDDRGFLTVEAGTVLTLKAMGTRKEVPHIFEQEDIDVVNAAIATRRPLLLRGEPGMGKSQLARAVAQQTGRAFISIVVDARTEPHDLRYRFDAVRRLGEAQLQGMRGREVDDDALSEARFVTPGPLWWAFDPLTAAEQAASQVVTRPWLPDGFTPKTDGTVVLIDEIDKADASVPNGLLEALGDRQFSVLGREAPIVQEGPPPVVVITTNEERTLPPAFLRRCWVYHMQPDDSLKAWLQRRGRAHFADDFVSDKVLDRAVDQLIADRAKLEGQQVSLPGQAELIDLLGALVECAPQSLKKTRKANDNNEVSDSDALEGAQLELLERISRYVFQKHPKGAMSR